MPVWQGRSGPVISTTDYWAGYGYAVTETYLVAGDWSDPADAATPELDDVPGDWSAPADALTDTLVGDWSAPSDASTPELEDVVGDWSAPQDALTDELVGFGEWSNTVDASTDPIHGDWSSHRDATTFFQPGPWSNMPNVITPELAGTPPLDLIVDEVLKPYTRHIRRIDIYESDGSTLWMENAPFSAGQITIDQSRAERRQFSATLDNIDSAFTPHPGGFWYDKVVKIYRGIQIKDYEPWEGQLGEFLIDSITQPRFPNAIAISGRDNAKRLVGAEFPTEITFGQNEPIEVLIRAIAFGGGIPHSKMQFPITGKNTDREHSFEAGNDRWDAMSKIALAHNYELFFRADGILILREHKDPVDDDPFYIFRTGTPTGNLADYTKSVSDTRIRNHIVVRGESTDHAPYWAEAKNELLGSPTSIANIGMRTEVITSSYISSNSQAQEVADRYLSIYAQEQFEVDMDALVAPWIDVGNVVAFEDPDPAPGDPEKFLLQQLTIPLELGTMNAKAGRVRLVN